MQLTKETEKIVNGPWQHGEHEVTWRLHTPKKKIRITDNIDIKNMKVGKYAKSICYSGLKYPLTDKFYSHLTTVIPLDAYPKKVLTKKDMINWLSISKKNKMLPRYIAPTKAVTDNELNVTFKLRSVANMQQLYIYLATVRYAKEDPGLVKIVLHLVNDLNIDYFLALCVGTYHAASQKGHNILPLSAGYPAPKKIDENNYDITYARYLKLFVNNPKKFNNKRILQDTSWDMHYLLRKMKANNTLCAKFEDFDSKEIQKHITIEEK